MSRQIQVGDIARINDVPYTIMDYDQQGIYIAPEEHPEQVSLLISQNNQWQVYDYDFPHRVTFEAAPKQFLTGVP